MKVPSAVKSHWFTLVLAGGLIVAMYQNVTLAGINAALRARILEALSEPVAVGDKLGVLRGVHLNGTYGEFDPKGRGMLVMTISSFCGACQKNRPSALRLAESARSRGLPVVWVSRDRPAETLAFFDDEAELARAKDLVLNDPAHEIYQMLHLGMVPQTLLVDAVGAVRSSVAGALDANDEALLLQAISKYAAQASLRGDDAKVK